jgi:hypothetical protein
MNDVAESNSASIGRLHAKARGFHGPDSFIVMIVLNRADIAPQLPRNQAS